MNTLDFEEPISIELQISKIALVNTIVGKSVYVEGALIESDSELDSEQIGFYCPEPLRHLLRQINLTVGDVITIKYLGRVRRKGTQIRDFFVERKKVE